MEKKKERGTSKMRLNSNGRKPVTYSIKGDVLLQYKEFCDKEGMLMSRRVELMMVKDMKENKT